MEKSHEYYMNIALEQAKKAFKRGEIPIGAVIVKDDKIIAKAYNCREKKKNSLLHAEIIAINKACKKLGNWRLFDCSIFVTVEPCLMCLGAIYNSRIKTVCFGADNKTCDGVNINYEVPILNHKVERVCGVLKQECETLLKMFFNNRRKV